MPLAAALAVHVAGLALTVPVGWHVDRTRTNCDPVQLLVLSSAPIRSAGPRPGEVEIILLEDHVNHPRGQLRRAAHFRWRNAQPLEGCCETPAAPGWLTWFRYRTRLLGFIVYPGRGVSPALRAQTLRVLDSLR